MKYLLLIVVVLVVLWLLAARRRGPRGPERETRRPGVEAMVVCAQCGVHLPRDEALPGRGGVFCSDAHRAAFEAAHRE